MQPQGRERTRVRARPRGVRLALLFLLALSLLLAAWSQAEQVNVAISGQPRLEGARVLFSVSVTGPEGVIGGLPPEAFTVTEAGQPANDLSWQPQEAGVALVIVVDRGGVAARNGCRGPGGGLRIGDARTLARTLVNGLVIDDPARPDDMVALVGIGDEDSGGATAFWPDLDFTYAPVDRNLVLNEVEFLDAQEHLLEPATTTPLYEGLDRALDWLTANGDPIVREELAHRHKLVLLLSDGIDRNYSDDAVELGMIADARAADINIYAVGLACADGSQLFADSLQHLAAQTGGAYWAHDSAAAHEDVLGRLPALLAYSQQYAGSYTTRLPAGEYTLRVRAETPLGADEDEARFFSPLQPPQLALSSPPRNYTVATGDALSATLPLLAEVTFPDGVERAVQVRFLVDDEPLQTVAAPPYEVAWRLDGLAPGSHVITAQALDSLLPGQSPPPLERAITVVAEEAAALAPTTRPVTPTAPPAIPAPGGETGTVANLFLWLVPLLLLVVGLLLFLLLRTRREVATAMASVSSGVSRGVGRVTTRLTQVLPGPEAGPARARLTITRGPGHGREFRLLERVTRFGRKASKSDELLDDSYVSAHHFSIIYDEERDSFWLFDPGSSNGTFVNGERVAPEQYMALPSGATIRAGQTELAFQRLGGPTRVLQKM